MCFADDLDSIGAPDCSALQAFACETLPSHSFAVRKNAEGIAWVVLEPPVLGPEHRRFTICRISPCVMVMVEDAAGRRQICSATDVEGAIEFVRAAADQAVLAAANAHPSHETLQ